MAAGALKYGVKERGGSHSFAIATEGQEQECEFVPNWRKLKAHNGREAVAGRASPLGPCRELPIYGLLRL